MDHLLARAVGAARAAQHVDRLLALFIAEGGVRADGEQRAAHGQPAVVRRAVQRRPARVVDRVLRGAALEQRDRDLEGGGGGGAAGGGGFLNQIPPPRNKGQPLSPLPL